MSRLDALRRRLPALRRTKRRTPEEKFVCFDCEGMIFEDAEAYIIHRMNQHNELYSQQTPTVKLAADFDDLMDRVDDSNR